MDYLSSLLSPLSISTPPPSKHTVPQAAIQNFIPDSCRSFIKATMFSTEHSVVATSSSSQSPPFFRHANYGTNEEKYATQLDYPKRPGFNTTGKDITVAINSYPVIQYPTKNIVQYDVSGTLILHSQSQARY